MKVVLRVGGGVSEGRAEGGGVSEGCAEGGLVIGFDRIFGSVRFGNSADFSRFGMVRFRFRLSEY